MTSYASFRQNSPLMPAHPAEPDAVRGRFAGSRHTTPGDLPPRREPDPQRPGPRWRRWAAVAVAVVLLVGVAWSLKGRGVLYAIRVELGLAKPLAARVEMQTGGDKPRWDRERSYAPVDPDLAFEQVALPVSAGVGYTCVAAGPDGRLWASSDDGRIFRFPVESDGALGAPEVFDSLQKAHGGPRLLTGFCFDPDAPAQAPVLYATHSDFAFHDARDWSGIISRVSGPDLEHVENLVVGLPRSVGDHATNQPAFGPDGALYIPQASNTAFGDADQTWGFRPEHLLSATILRIDLARLPRRLPLDVQTDDGGEFDPAAPGAPVTVHAFGVRLAYDLCWADDGRLYAPVNGSSAGGNVPADPGGAAPALRAVPTAEPDWLIRVKPGAYHGHPNPRQGYYVLNGGNPTAGADFGEVREYPVGTQPDPRWVAPIADLGDHQSADGLIQFRAVGETACERKLDRALLICRYSFGADLVAVHLTPDGEIADVVEGIPGLTGFANPLDVTQDPRTGFLYVSDYGAQTIVLLRPTSADAASAASTGAIGR